ncbi:hypothetical protein DVJ78_17975 (plasmid) [Humibacter sp. BT305]|nr:hypothetical protein DVJ78_17975 [Humibacter sp. BT305]
MGDIGRLDDDGYLYVLDRADDVIDRGGEKIYPAEIEHVLEQHPAVRGSVAFGVPDDEYGQLVHAVADTADDTVSAAELLAFAATHLAPGRRPDGVRIVHEPLRDDAGKVRRARLSAQAAREPGTRR